MRVRRQTLLALRVMIDLNGFGKHTQIRRACSDNVIRLSATDSVW